MISVRGDNLIFFSADFGWGGLPPHTYHCGVPFGDLKVDFSGLKVDSRSCPYPVTTRTHSGGDLRTRCVVIKVSWWSAIRRLFFQCFATHPNLVVFEFEAAPNQSILRDRNSRAVTILNVQKAVLLRTVL